MATNNAINIGVVAGGGFTYTFPSATDTLLGHNDIGVLIQGYDADLDTWATKTAPSGTVVGTTDTQTLSGKTLTAPKFADLGYVADANANKMLVFDSNTSAVNYLRISNGATTFSPTIYADGTDTNVYLNLQAKGNGVVLIQDGAVPTKMVGFTLSGASAVTSTNLIFSQTTARDITFPDATDTLVGKATTDTLTNKTLTSPSIATPTFTSQVGFGAHTAYFTETDNGNSGTADTIDWGTSNKQKSTLTGNCTFTFTAPSGPCTLLLKLVQDGTGSRTVTWPSTVHWPGGTAPTLTTTASKVDIISFYWDGATYFGNSSLNYTA